MQLSQNQKIFSQFSFISKICIKFRIVWKRRWSSEVISFLYYRLEKAGLLKCLKSLVSEQLWTANILKGPKHCLNFRSRIFVIFFDHPEKKSAKKLGFSSIGNLETVSLHIYTQWNVWSLSKKERYTQAIQMQLSPNQKIFCHFFLPFWNLHKSLKYFEKEDDPQRLFFLKL